MSLGKLSFQEIRETRERLAGKHLTTKDQPPIVFIADREEISPNQGIPAPQIRSWLNLGRDLQRQDIDYREIWSYSSPSSSRLVVVGSAGYQIWFDLAEDLEKQMQAYKTFERMRPKEVRVLEYVDARIPSRLYVK
jgi:hypothetical protein